MQTTLDEFLGNCDEASWLLTIGQGEDSTIASGASSKPHCGEKRVMLAGITLPKELVGEVAEEGRNAGKLVDGVLVEDEAIFKINDAALIVWRITKKES